MKFSFIQSIRFRGDNARVFQQISMNLNMTHADYFVDKRKARWLRCAFA